MIISASILLSLTITSSVFPYLSGRASPKTSTGLLKLELAGKKSFNFLTVSSLNFARLMSFSSIASVAMIPGPPALVIMAIFLPLGRGCQARAVA